MSIRESLVCRIPREERALSAAERVGNCYRLAAKVVAYGVDSEAALVHGSIEGMGCVRNPHAWVVLGNGNCYDAVLDLELPGDAHERFFSAVEDARYSRMDVLAKLRMEQTWGPWA